MSALALTIEKPASSTRPAAGMAEVVPLRAPRQPLRKRELVIGANSRRAIKVATTPVPLAAFRTSLRPQQIAAIDDFVGRDGKATKKHEALTTEDQAPFTLADIVATTFIFV